MHKVIGILFGFSLLISCNSQQEEVVVEETPLEDPATCDCSEIYFDQPYNQFYYSERNKGYTGTCESFYANGQKKEHKSFVEGKVHGKHFLYYDNGQIEEEKEFDMNFQIGEQIIYSKKGEVIYHALYKRGVQTQLLVSNPHIPKIDIWDR